MAFVKRTWKNRNSQYPARRTLTRIDTQVSVDYEVTRAEGTVTEAGDDFSAENMNDLEQRIADAFDGVTINVDSALSTTSKNPVQNKVITTRLNTLNSAVTNKANKVDLTNISISGTTNNTGSTIASGTFFYKDGDLVKAKTSIANGATLTLNTNYEVVTAGGLNDLNASLTNIHNSVGSGVINTGVILSWRNAYANGLISKTAETKGTYFISLKVCTDFPVNIPETVYLTVEMRLNDSITSFTDAVDNSLSSDTFSSNIQCGGPGRINHLVYEGFCKLEANDTITAYISYSNSSYQLRIINAQLILIRVA